MSDACYPYRRLARNALLANARLHAACLALQPGEWEARRTSFFPSLKATLNHILLVDRFYLDAVQGGTLGTSVFADEEPCATAADLAREQAALDSTALAIAEGLAPPDLARQVRIHRADRVQVETLGDTLLHLFLHDQHHRGQVHAMLSGTSVKPPQLDEFFMDDDARFRLGDLEREGRDEGWIRR